MGTTYAAPWHRASYERFVNERLPELLAARLPLTGYRVEEADAQHCRLWITLATGKGEITVAFELLQPDADGLFHVFSDRPHVVVPLASSEHLEQAEIRCVGEQLYDHIEPRLGDFSADLPWDEALVRTLLPLESWVREVVTSNGGSYSWGGFETGQWLDITNWLAIRAHTRRIVIPNIEKVVTPSQFGRVCPFETPEGPNIGHVFSLAVGAEIRNGRLVIVDDRPESTLGYTASQVPFLEHNDPNRQLMGVNMMRQWLPPQNAEPAIIRTGNEPDVPEVWAGFNLFTAFVSWGPETYEDAILISESCARRMQYELPVRVGDKFSNRHGAKGVVSRIVPDAEMPHLADGTPVELVYSFLSIHARMNIGQLREAVMSRVARTEGEPAIVPPFHAPSEEELRRRLLAAGLPVDGMEVLTDGKDGKPLQRASLAGWVYWGRTVHIAEDKIHVSVTPEGPCQRQGELEYYALRDVRAFAYLAETYNTRSAEREDAGTLADRLAADPVAQAGPPAPLFARLQSRLGAAGIRAELGSQGVRFTFTPLTEGVLTLAAPVPHPWMGEHSIDRIGVVSELPGFTAVEEGNSKLARLLTGKAPAALIERAQAELQERLERFFTELLVIRPGASDDPFLRYQPSRLMRFNSRVLFSGRTVLSPSYNLSLEQLGVPEEIAWTLFAPLVTREIGDADSVAARSSEAAQALDAVMARSWVVLNRAPTFMPTALLAFRPVRVPDMTLHLHPLACMLMNGDYDGDQAAVFLPITEEGQRDAAERLSIAGHLRRDPSLIKWVFPNHEMLWGLATLSMAPDGKREIEEILGVDITAPDGYITRETMTAVLKQVLAERGTNALFAVLERLAERGFAVIKANGASISPFMTAGLARPPQPTDDDPAAWNRYQSEMLERIISRADFEDRYIGPQLLAVKSGARGNTTQLLNLLAGRGLTTDASGCEVATRHSLVDGVTPAEMFSLTAGARQGLARVVLETTRTGYGVRDYEAPAGYGVLARAMRADFPGVVFAHAAAAGEVDPLTDLDSRLYVGLPA